MVLVLEDGVVVSVHADAIGEHLLLVVEEGVGAEVVREVDALVHRRRGAGAGAAAAAAADAVGARTVAGGAIPEAAHGSRRKRGSS